MSADPPAGWVTLDGLLQPGERIMDYAARRQRVAGACKQDGCTRRVVIDPLWLANRGVGPLPIGEVKRLHRCNRIGGCGLSFHDEPADLPLRLRQCVGRPNVRIRVSCRGDGCRFFRAWLVEEIVAGLVKRRQGDDETEVQALRGLMRSPCPLCKRRSWDVDVLWINTETMGWKARGDACFEEVAARRARG